ncbi:hypothetical protein FDG2_1418 [Candidatus Protofrankia californiensis]|uniref:Uncharacterized protein n=1 Tax=Candidatus Protofrankia californiensis TaxID=1839754 RepID=A0A1C3NVP0_9ACTN|nr:hypothetical protein FDG2_1418 [Candidatus Protofrankia californiensis]
MASMTTDPATETIADKPADAGVVLDEDLGDGRSRLHAQSLVDSFESRDAWLRRGMETGINEGYAKLDSRTQAKWTVSVGVDFRRSADTTRQRSKYWCRS